MNRLAKETSPYLLQHRHHPVHWQPWDQAALDQARQEQKPILLSVGYAACHWCHVMAHECFEDPDIAAVMNDLFVSIKVDREERPDLDTQFQAALAMMGQHGGWPLTLFLTPEGRPFWGGTYFPPQARYNRPGFVEVLQAVDQAWHQQKDQVAAQAGQLEVALQQLGASQTGIFSPALIPAATEKALTYLDPVHGGLGGAPKFPHCSALALLWHQGLKRDRQDYRKAVLLTLNRMSQGGIYDHLGGGYARYSVDELWLVPHFEKMLYDNAQFLELLTLVWRQTRTPLWAQRVEETVTWLLREMLTAEGGFASALDADSEGEEGRYYVWTRAQIDACLGEEEAALFCQTYGIEDRPSFEGRYILHRLKTDPGDPIAESDEERRLAACRERLRQERAHRVAPQRDDKILVDWNGMTVSALVQAGMVFDRPDWVTAAQACFSFLCEYLQTPAHRLHHVYCAGQARHTALLDDYAQMARAAVMLFQATGRWSYIDQAETWMDIADHFYWDTGQGGYFLSASDRTDVLARAKPVADLSVPAGNAVMVGVLQRLWVITGQQQWRDRAEAVVAAFAGGLSRQGFHCATLLHYAEALAEPAQLVLLGDSTQEQGAAMLQAAWTAPRDVVIIPVDENDQRGLNIHGAGKERLDGKATAYLCWDTACQPPINDPETLTAALHGPGLG